MKLKICSKNADGLQDTHKNTLRKFITECARRRNKGAAQVFLAQEHNLDPTREDDVRELAIHFKFHYAIAFAPPAANGTHYGGTLTLIDEKSAQLKTTTIHDPGMLETVIDWDGVMLKIVNVYAPAKPLKRIDYLRNLRTKFAEDMIMGGDWNCVADVLLDVQGTNPLAYANHGSALLDQILTDVKLLDFRRDQLHLSHEPTRLGVNRNGDAIATRIDRFVVPTIESHEHYLWSLEVEEDFVWSSKPAENSDHFAITATIETPTGEMGRDRKMPREDLLLEEKVQEQVIRKLHQAYEQGGTEIKKWQRAHNEIRSYLINETSKRRAKEKRELRQKLKLAACMRQLMNEKGPTPTGTQALKKVQAQIYELRNPKTTYNTGAAQDIRMFEQSDNCTRRFFSTYKATSKQNWINEMKTTLWQEDVTPIFTGKTRTVGDVPNALKDYYTMLYDTKTTSDAQMKKAWKLLRKKQLLPDTKAALETDYTVKEIQAVMEHLPLGKSAGPNRVPNAVYRYLSAAFAPKFLKMINEAITRQSLPDHMMEGEISVLYKKGDRDDPRNYRPITLLNADYKIYTKLLAARMKTAVHEFVSGTQKGFVPKELIHDCTTLLNMIEAYINEEPEQRQGLFLFFDMEKAFDRCSYKFLNGALKATNFGPNFRKQVGMMYNELAPPKRRIYANGYLSEWFPVKSGVAQGCPLSPLLFLFVAEALKMTIEADKKIQGIKVGDKTYLLSQFADDTTALLHCPKSIRPIERAIRKWGQATGMRENMLKREGLKMGKLRNSTLPPPTNWIKDGEWAKSLGYPIGNNLNPETFWNKKMAEIEKMASRWISLKRSTYFGRNLIVQAMYFGKLRYWLYNLFMNKALRTRIQAGADQLWWSKDPDFDNPKRFRRFVARDTAIGPPAKGGLGLMDWNTHVQSFTSQLIIRYVDPSKALWKTVLDHILFTNKRGECTHPEGRAVLFAKLPKQEQRKLIYRLPKTAKHLRGCLKDFWDLGLKPADPPTERHIGSESLWWNHSFEIKGIKWQDRNYMRNVLEMIYVSDIMDSETNRPITSERWKEWIDDLHKQRYGTEPDNYTFFHYLELCQKVVEQVPAEIKRQLRRPYLLHTPENDQLIGLAHEKDDQIRYGYYQARQPNRIVKAVLDNMGMPRRTAEFYMRGNSKLLELQLWPQKKNDIRVAGPIHASFPANTRWEMCSEHFHLWELTIKLNTKTRQAAKMEPPSAQEGWEIRYAMYSTLHPFPWRKIWKLRPKYVSARDKLTWLKLKHRNLFTANQDRHCMNQKCLACDDELESQLHLAECEDIRRDFWAPILEVTSEVGLTLPQDEDDLPRFLIFGLISTTDVCSEETAGMIALGWRCLYAEIQRCREEMGAQLNLRKAAIRTLSMIQSRVTAFGERWRRWYLRTHHTSKAQLVAPRYRKFKLLEVNQFAEYTVNPKIARKRESLDT